VVTKPQNVMVMRDVACAGYVAGCNTLFFAQDSEGGNYYSAQNATKSMMERLSFSNDVGAKYASMLAFPCTAQQMSSGHLDTVMSVTTRLLPWEVTSSSGGDHHSFPGGQAVYGAYSNALNLRSVHFGEDMKAAENQDFISQGSTNNATCFVGPHRQYDPFTKSFLNLVPGQGHFGPDAIPGVSSSRIQTIALFPCTFTTQLQPRFRPPVAGCALAPRRVRLPQDGPRHDGRPRARAARPDGLLGALNAPLIVGLRDQEARRVLAAIGGTTVAELGRVCVRVRPPGVLTECVTFKRRLYQKPTR
jgi:hypothetical protein